MRNDFLKELYDAFYEKGGTGVIVDVAGEEGRDKELIYKPFVDVGLMEVKGHGMGKRMYTITARGIFKVEEMENENNN